MKYIHPKLFFSSFQIHPNRIIHLGRGGGEDEFIMNEYCCIRVIARIKIVIKNPIFTSFKKSAQNVEIELNHKLFNSIWPVLYLNIISIFCNLISITVKIFSNPFPQKYPFSRRNIPFEENNFRK